MFKVLCQYRAGIEPEVRKAQSTLRVMEQTELAYEQEEHDARLYE